MCGIIGGITREGNLVPDLLERLQRLEYRGYDSAGIAVLSKENNLERRRVCGKIAKLQEAIIKDPVYSQIGIAHTRWATHGAANLENSHPHLSKNFAIVHNGIIENYQELKTQLQELGYIFSSSTDTEVIVHYLDYFFSQVEDTKKALSLTLEKLKGAYALAVISSYEKDKVLVARCGSPLIIGTSDTASYVASDGLALVGIVNAFFALEEGDIAEIYYDSFRIFDKNRNPVVRDELDIKLEFEQTSKSGFKHYMQKEIFEQSDVARKTISGYINDSGKVDCGFDSATLEKLKCVQAIQIVACGTSYHAGMIVKYWVEEMLSIPCFVEIASEFRYRKNIVLPNTLAIFISQSGETADTLAALRSIKKNNICLSMAVCNVKSSSLVRESDISLLTKAGPEIGVASTKAFSTQLIALFCLCLTISRGKNLLSMEDENQYIRELKVLPNKIQQALSLDEKIKLLAKKVSSSRNAIYLGRNTLYPLALEGALKLKEISYIHAQSYPAGELKHGPLALVDSEVPVVALVANDSLLDKLNSNLEEVSSRGGRIIVFAEIGANVIKRSNIDIIRVPNLKKMLPILMVIPMQLLAYYTAVLRGTNVDQPRNLAKSVTVE